METLLDVLLTVLLVMPIASAIATLYFARLVKDAVSPPILLMMLTASAIVTFVCGSYLAALTLNARLLGNTNPPSLAPLTVGLLDALLAPTPIIAFMLWRVSRSARRGRLTADVPDEIGLL